MVAALAVVVMRILLVVLLVVVVLLCDDCFPPKSLRDRRWKRWEGEEVFTFSRDGVYPRYQAVGEDGDRPVGGCLIASSTNMGFGACMLPSEPLRVRTAGRPRPSAAKGWLW